MMSLFTKSNGKKARKKLPLSSRLKLKNWKSVGMR